MKVTCLALLMIALSAQGATSCAGAELLSPSTWFGGSGKTTLSPKPGPKSSLLKAPPVVGKMTSGTKRLLTSPTSLFKKTKPKQVKTSGVTKVTKAKRNESEREGFFKSIFNPEPPPPPRTIDEFMSLEQIHP